MYDFIDMIMNLFGLDEEQKKAAIENSEDGGFGGIGTSAGRKGHGQSALKQYQDSSQPQLGGLLAAQKLAPKRQQRQPLPASFMGILNNGGFGG